MLLTRLPCNNVSLVNVGVNGTWGLSHVKLTARFCVARPRKFTFELINYAAVNFSLGEHFSISTRSLLFQPEVYYFNQKFTMLTRSLLMEPEVIYFNHNFILRSSLSGGLVCGVGGPVSSALLTINPGGQDY